MVKTKSNAPAELGNENSYTKEFFEELYQKLSVEDESIKSSLSRYIILAAQAYLRGYSEYEYQLPSNEVKKELKKAVNLIDKADKYLCEVFVKGKYGEDIVDNLYEVINKKYPPLHGLLKEIKKDYGGIVSGTRKSPARSIVLLRAMSEGINLTLKNYEAKNAPPKSKALYKWIMILSAKLEPIIGHKLEQSHYYKTDEGGEYISNKEMNDSDLLLFIIKPLDPRVTVSQMETIIKETRKERHESPWVNYFPGE